MVSRMRYGVSIRYLSKAGSACQLLPSVALHPRDSTKTSTQGVSRLRALNRLQGVSDASAGLSINFYDTRSLGLLSPPRRQLQSADTLPFACPCGVVPFACPPIPSLAVGSHQAC